MNKMKIYLDLSSALLEEEDEDYGSNDERT